MSSFIKPVVASIGVASLGLVALGGLFIEQSSAPEEAQATVAPEPIEIAAAPSAAPSEILPEVEPSRPNLGFRPLTDPFGPWPLDGRKTELTFVQLSDTHVGHDKDHETFERAINVINRMNPRPAFVVISGDLTDHFSPPQIKLFKKLLAKLKVPVNIVPGNHDVMFSPTQKRLSWWSREFPEVKTPYRADHGPVTIIGVDSQLWNARNRSRDVAQVASQQWAQMEALISQARADGQRVMVLNHIPAVPTFYPARLAQSWTTPRMHAYLDMLDRHGVEAELSGHVHRDEAYVHNKTFFLTAPPISQKYTRNASLRHFRVTDQGLMYRQIYLYRHGEHLSYEFDLHGVDEANFAAWIDTMSQRELARLWSYRYAGDSMTERWFPKLDFAMFRSYLKEPFEHQPIGKVSQRFKRRRAPRGRRRGL